MPLVSKLLNTKSVVFVPGNCNSSPRLFISTIFPRLSKYFIKGLCPLRFVISLVSIYANILRPLSLLGSYAEVTSRIPIFLLPNLLFLKKSHTRPSVDRS